MIELSGARIHAVPYRNRRALKAVKIPDGAIVEKPTLEQRGQAPKNPPAYLQVPGEDIFIGILGVFLLPSGDVAAVYGSGRNRSADPI